MSSWPITTTTLKRINDGCIKNETVQTTKKKTTKTLKTNLSPIQFDFAFILHPARCWAETAITCPLIVRTSSCAMRNFLATLSPYRHAPNVTFPVCVRVCVRVPVRACIHLFTTLVFTGESTVLGNYPASKNTKQIQSEDILSYIALVLTTV